MKVRSTLRVGIRFCAREDWKQSAEGQNDAIEPESDILRGPAKTRLGSIRCLIRSLGVRRADLQCCGLVQLAHRSQTIRERQKYYAKARVLDPAGNVALLRFRDSALEPRTGGGELTSPAPTNAHLVQAPPHARVIEPDADRGPLPFRR